jgi:hypothetical protein
MPLVTKDLGAARQTRLSEVGKALASLGGQFDAPFEQLGRIEAAVEETHAVAVETHGAVLDLQTELQRSGGEAHTLMEQVLLRLGQVGMARGDQATALPSLLFSQYAILTQAISG